MIQRGRLSPWSETLSGGKGFWVRNSDQKTVRNGIPENVNYEIRSRLRKLVLNQKVFDFEILKILSYDVLHSTSSLSSTQPSQHSPLNLLDSTYRSGGRFTKTKGASKSLSLNLPDLIETNTFEIAEIFASIFSGDLRYRSSVKIFSEDHEWRFFTVRESHSILQLFNLSKRSNR